MKEEAGTEEVRKLVRDGFKRGDPLDKYTLKTSDIPQFLIEVIQHQEEENQQGKGFQLLLSTEFQI